MKNIFLIGFMGCGKSAVASHMMHVHGKEVVEMDEWIVEREGMSIPEIFEQKGETYFRNIETKLLEELQDKYGKVVSCGGGVVTKHENVETMKKSGIVVLLTATPETILERVKEDDNRPLLNGNKNLTFIRELMEKRQMLYEDAADVIIATDNKSVADVCVEILSKL